MFNDLPGQFYSTFIQNDRWKMFLDGFGMTMLIAVGAVILGLVSWNYCCHCEGKRRAEPQKQIAARFKRHL